MKDIKISRGNRKLFETIKSNRYRSKNRTVRIKYIEQELHFVSLQADSGIVTGSEEEESMAKRKKKVNHLHEDFLSVVCHLKMKQTASPGTISNGLTKHREQERMEKIYRLIARVWKGKPCQRNRAENCCCQYSKKKTPNRCKTKG